MDIGQERFKVRTVLDRNGRFRRKGRPDRFPATGTAPDGTAMLGRDQRLGRQIEHLSRFDRQVVFLFEWSEIATGTSLRQMDKNPVRDVPFVLPTSCLWEDEDSWTRVWSSRPMTGLARVLAVLGNLDFQCADASQQILDLGQQRQNDIYKDKGEVIAIASSSSRVKALREEGKDPGGLSGS